MSKRLKFFLSHLTISFLIALLAVGVVFFVWYPAPLAKAVGVTHIFLMMLIIDVIVGPILGFLVYKQGKKNLKFDLSVIILLQICAFGYGIYSIADGRPVWLVYSVDRIELIRNNDIQQQPHVKIKPQYQHPSWTSQQYVAVQLSKNHEQKQNDMFNAIFGLTLAQQPDRYVPYLQSKSDIQKNAQSLEILKQFNDKKQLKAILAQYPQANAFVPLKAGHVDMTVLLDKNTGEVIKIVDLRPWR